MQGNADSGPVAKTSEMTCKTRRFRRKNDTTENRRVPGSSPGLAIRELLAGGFRVFTAFRDTIDPTESAARLPHVSRYRRHFATRELLDSILLTPALHGDC